MVISSGIKKLCGAGMNIVVVGTSNSVMGNNGFIKSLALEHDVTQLSSGRTPFYSCLKTIMINKDLIESADLLILDHYINDVNFYGNQLSFEYRDHLKEFYNYLSALNVEIINLMFPIADLDEQEGAAFYSFTKVLCQKHEISVLDLNLFEIEDDFYIDNIHLNHDVSYALGLALNSYLSSCTWEKPSGGACEQTPFTVLSERDIDLSNIAKIGQFSNSLMELEYLELEKEVTVARPEEDKLIAIGFLRDEKNLEGLSGIRVNGKEYGFEGGGYFMEAMDEDIKGSLTISPLSGFHDVDNLMGRGRSKGEFNYCYLSELMFFNKAIEAHCQPAQRIAKEIRIDSFIPIATRLSLIKQSSPLQKFKPKTIDKLRDVALSMESKDLEIARDMLLLATLQRKDGEFINNKLAQYEKLVDQSIFKMGDKS